MNHYSNLWPHVKVKSTRPTHPAMYVALKMLPFFLFCTEYAWMSHALHPDASALRLPSQPLSQTVIYNGVCVGGEGVKWLPKVAGIISEPPQSRFYQGAILLMLFQFRPPPEGRRGRKRLSIFISLPDLFWVVIKASLWGFSHNGLSSTVYTWYTLPRFTGPSLIKSVKLWIYSQACKINEGKDLI